MRIVYVLTTLAVGGTERQVLALAGRMAARGHSVAILVLKAREPDDCATALDVVHLDIQKTASSLISGLRRGVAFLRVFRADVVHSHNFHGNMLARMMRLFYRETRLISTIHNVYEGGRLRMLAYRMSDRFADGVTAVSVAVAERFVKVRAVAGEKCVVITNGIETGDFVPNHDRRAAVRAQMGAGNDFVWLTVGRVTAAKDLQNLFGAFGSVLRSNGQTQLWIAGGAPAHPSGKSAYLAVAVAQGAVDKFRRLGLRRDIPMLLDAADGFVLASAWEGMPLAVGEAMAMEKPVVATDVGGVRELVGDAGVLIPAKDANALSGAMLQMMQRSPEERAAMGGAGRERILKDFDMDQKADEWEMLYRSVQGYGVSKPAVLP